MVEIARESIDRVLEIRGRQLSRAREVYQRSLGFQGEEGARQEMPGVQLSSQPPPPSLAEGCRGWI